VPRNADELVALLDLERIDDDPYRGRPLRADKWWLYDQVSPSASGGRGPVTAHVFTRNGTLVASVAQEALIRRRKQS
jgi:acyl-CoA thioesterase-2